VRSRLHGFGVTPVSSLEQEREALIAADRHLVAGEQRIAEQFALIQKMNLQGYDTAVAWDLLHLLEQTLATWQDHRQLILDAIARYEQSASQVPKPDPGP
jgi:hypothetical protein